MMTDEQQQITEMSHADRTILTNAELLQDCLDTIHATIGTVANVLIDKIDKDLNNPDVDSLKRDARITAEYELTSVNVELLKENLLLRDQLRAVRDKLQCIRR